MTGRFRTRAVRRIPGPLLFLVVVLAGISIFELYRWIIPLQSLNPLWHEVTIGEPVIDSWLYGGRDEEGYLRFYDQAQTIVVPPTAHTFAADGQFVVIEEFSSSSLTFAEPFEAIPVSWIAIGGVGFLASLWLLFRRLRRGSILSGGSLRRSPLILRHKPPFTIAGKRTSKRFRASRRPHHSKQ
ncbi:MAG: hypothetical protein A2201_04155 [Alicyclobacillus sp. RIFOXYA1_FULL_53_8]|nr:MAG: hypothetical protein A2201_04155 [Alicyclobacillus sp. RIFOXYA1_FULL_53_8]